MFFTGYPQLRTELNTKVSTLCKRFCNVVRNKFEKEENSGGWGDGAKGAEHLVEVGAREAAEVGNILGHVDRQA